jgi:hypothetical protein
MDRCDRLRVRRADRRRRPSSTATAGSCAIRRY